MSDTLPMVGPPRFTLSGGEPVIEWTGFFLFVPACNKSMRSLQPGGNKKLLFLGFGVMLRM
jgi:hypothetical protein